jgi:serine protease Do
MSASRNRQHLTLALVLGATIFGMVLASGLELTPAARSGPATVNAAQGGGAPGGFPDFADLAEAVDPAVVSISATKIDRSGARQRGGGGGANPFEFFFGPRRNTPPPGGQSPRQEEPEPFRSDAGGSGFVVSADGLIVTNYHVIQGADRLTVTLGNREYPAEVRGTDPSTDLALLKIEPGRQLTYLNLGDSDRLRVGEWVIAVGSPLNLQHTVTVGVVSAKGRNLGISDSSFENFIQTDAAINFGNSGGPLLNIRGEVVGINTAINYEAENIGFAVPVNTLKSILPQLRDRGKVSRGYLGLSVGEVTWEAAESFGLPEPTGVLVRQVLPDKPGARAGIKPEDVILKADGRTLKASRELIDYVSGKPPGTTVELEVLREGKRMKVDVKLAERETDTAAAPAPSVEEEKGIEWLGVRYQDLSSSSRSTHNLPEDLEGVWITDVGAESPLYGDLGAGGGQLLFVITKVDGKAVKNVEEFERSVKSKAAGSRLRFYVRVFDPRGQEAPALLVYPRVP